MPKDTPISGIFQYHQAMALYRTGIKVGVIAPAPLFGRNLLERIMRLPLGYVTDKRFPFPTITYQGSVLWPGRFIKGSQIFWNRNAMRLFQHYYSLYGRPDLIHAHEVSFAGCFAMELADNLHIPYIITEHSSTFIDGSIKVNKRIKAAYRQAHARLMVSHFLGKAVETKIGNDATPWKCVPNILPVDFEHASPLTRNSNDRFRFLCVAQFSQVKNHLCLLKAFTKAFQGSDVELILAGDGPLLAAAKKSAQELGIFSQVTFIGFQTRIQVLEEMLHCDVLVLPSLRETFGVVLIEAMSCGKPVIAPAGSGPDDIVNKDNGLLFHPDDFNDLANAMNIIFTNFSHFDPKSIRAECISRYGESAIVSKLVNIYSRIINKSSYGHINVDPKMKSSRNQK